ncbi:STAS domain-containing protein [Streptomyces sp. NPDC006333]|uniref:STAS domain-containing protein n=1 Tax=Streptomyces sp. NPDC006333 TaxID=3156753 RepID=UPI0033A7B7DF
MTEAEMTDTEQAQQPGGLTVFSTTSENIRVLTLHGEIDHQTGGTLQNTLAATAPPGPRVVADMHDVAFMDSTGINILIAAHRDLSEAGGWLRLAPLPHQSCAPSNSSASTPSSPATKPSTKPSPPDRASRAQSPHATTTAAVTDLAAPRAKTPHPRSGNAVRGLPGAGEGPRTARRRPDAVQRVAGHLSAS